MVIAEDATGYLSASEVQRILEASCEEKGYTPRLSCWEVGENREFCITREGWVFICKNLVSDLGKYCPGTDDMHFGAVCNNGYYVVHLFGHRDRSLDDSEKEKVMITDYRLKGLCRVLETYGGSLCLGDGMNKDGLEILISLPASTLH